MKTFTQRLHVFVILICMAAVISSCTIKRQFVITGTDERIIGEVEPVTIKKAGLTLPARIDTGATTSSIDATDITHYERDGKSWVRFNVRDKKNGKTSELECRLSRTVQIKRHGKESQERPVVKLRTILGPVEQVREFSLTDRSAFEYPVLIGRNYLQGEFVVDVNRKNTSSPMNEKQDNEK